MVPEDALREGRNTVEVLEVTDEGRWFSWLAAELAAAALLTGCLGIGDEESAAQSAERHPPVSWSCSTSSRPTTCSDRTARSTPSAFPTSRSWRRCRPGSRTATPRTTPPSRPCRRSSTAGCPSERTAADVRSHKPSVFHLMDRLGYEVFKVESASAVCPPDICPGARTRRPGCSRGWRAAGRPARFHRWVGAIRRRPEPAFYFHHALMPHEPWIYLPSGAAGPPRGERPDRGLNKLPGFDDPDLSVHNHLRHLLQVGYTDHQVGRAARPAAAHRAARAGAHHRDRRPRLLVPGRRAQLAAAERPQRRGDRARAVLREGAGPDGGRGHEGLVRNIDIVATIADLLGSRRSTSRTATRRSPPRRGRRRVRRPHARLRPGGAHRAARDGAAPCAVAAALGAAVRDRGREQVLYGDPWAMAYRIGPHSELLGRRVAALRRPDEPIRRGRECGALPRRERAARSTSPRA